MDNLVETLKTRDLPDDPVYLTLDILIEYNTAFGSFPSYRTIARTLGELLGKNPVSTATVQRYLLQLEDNRRIERIGRRWKLTGGRFTYGTT